MNDDGSVIVAEGKDIDVYGDNWQHVNMRARMKDVLGIALVCILVIACDF